jgi:hypothetical protein
MPDRRAFVAALALLAARPALAAFDLPALMALLARRKSGEARFTEERIVSTFDSPLRASGTLSFAAPDRFTRTTLEPRPERLEVQGNTIVLVRGGRTRQLTLDAVPELAVLVDAMRGTLAGDAALLQKHFRPDVSGTPARWVLALTPLDARLATHVRSIEIVGQDADVRSVALALGGGDRSLMLIEPLK